MQSNPPVRGAGWASVMQGLLIFVPTVVLGAAVNWPESLSDPASIALPRLAENEGAVRFGYVAYLVYSVLFAVTITLLARLVEHDLVMGIRRLVIGFAVGSTCGAGDRNRTRPLCLGSKGATTTLRPRCAVPNLPIFSQRAPSLLPTSLLTSERLS